MAPRSPQARRPSKIWAPRSFMDRTEHVCLAPRSWRHSCRFRLTEVGADLWDVDLREFDRYARRHHGLLDFEASGLTRKQWNRASAAEVAELRHRNVMRLYGAPPTVEMRIEAAVLAAGPDAMGSHRSAATTWGVDRPADDPIDIILSRPRCRRSGRRVSSARHHGHGTLRHARRGSSPGRASLATWPARHRRTAEGARSLVDRRQAG